MRETLLRTKPVVESSRPSPCWSWALGAVPPRGCRSMSEAGRKLFAASRARRNSVNDADRLAKYLARHDLDWPSVRDAVRQPR